MSSRALRRLQREAEERKQLQALQKKDVPATDEVADEEEDNDDDDAHATETFVSSRRKVNAFDFLNPEAEDDDDDESDNEASGQTEDHYHRATPTKSTPSTPRQTKKKSKKKKKKTSKATTPEPEPEQDLDEIDLALKSLSTQDPKGPTATQANDYGLRAFYELLQTDSKHLNPLNEMKKLFGSAVLEGDRESTSNRRRGRGPTQLDLGAALAGRHNQASRGQTLAGLALRRNALMVGKEEWPKATSGGLGMEIVEAAEDFTIEYRFVHSSLYQGTQRQFDLCVESLDPQRIIQHLHLNPYHISTLLQVSEIAQHQGDHAVAVDLLERALFTFGRSVQSTFAASMASGKARMDFRRPENREFWLAGYRYIATLAQRGTWRTAFEWGRLLLSLDPEQDPYRLHLVIHQLAIRAGQFEALVKLASTSTDTIDWGQNTSNVQISLAMAYYKLKDLEKARSQLQKATQQFPWVIAHLCKELNIEPIPKAVWGREPRTPREQMYTLSYGLRAKDIWNTPEGLSFLNSVLDTLPREEPPAAATERDEINLSYKDCRYLILSGDPTLMGLLPPEIANYRVSSSDPLPPSDSIPSYNITTPEPTRDEWEEELAADRREAAGLQSWFGGILRRLGVTLGANTSETDTAAVAEVAAALEASGMDMQEIAARTSRMEELRDREEIALGRIRQIGEAEDDSDIEQDTTDTVRAEQPRFPVPEINLPPEESPERAPLQASVEEVPDEDGSPFTGSSSTNQQPQPLLTPSHTDEPNSSNATGPASSSSYDDEANQRWLAGRGMFRLKEFISAHGSDENEWKDNMDIDITPATEYAHRITLLKKNSSKEFILNYALKQGAGAQASALIRRLLS